MGLAERRLRGDRGAKSLHGLSIIACAGKGHAEIVQGLIIIGILAQDLLEVACRSGTPGLNSGHTEIEPGRDELRIQDQSPFELPRRVSAAGPIRIASSKLMVRESHIRIGA